MATESRRIGSKWEAPQGQTRGEIHAGVLRRRRMALVHVRMRRHRDMKRRKTGARIGPNRHAPTDQRMSPIAALLDQLHAAAIARPDKKPVPAMQSRSTRRRFRRLTRRQSAFATSPCVGVPRYPRQRRRLDRASRQRVRCAARWSPIHAALSLPPLASLVPPLAVSLPPPLAIRRSRRARHRRPHSLVSHALRERSPAAPCQRRRRFPSIAARPKCGPDAGVLARPARC